MSWLSAGYAQRLDRMCCRRQPESFNFHQEGRPARISARHTGAAQNVSRRRAIFFSCFSQQRSSGPSAKIPTNMLGCISWAFWRMPKKMPTYAKKSAAPPQKDAEKEKLPQVLWETQSRKKKTNVLCETCGVHLCFTKTRNCFTAWHERWSSFRSAVFLICVKNGFMQIVYFSFRIFLDHFPSKCIFWILFVRNIFVDIVFCLYCFSQVPAKVVDFRFFISFVTTSLFWNLCYL